MARGLDDAVRAYQLPNAAPGQPNQSGLSPNVPIYITAGFGNVITAGSIGQGLSPAIQLGAAHYDITITFYMDQAAVEATEET